MNNLVMVVTKENFCFDVKYQSTNFEIKRVNSYIFSVRLQKELTQLVLVLETVSSDNISTDFTPANSSLLL